MKQASFHAPLAFDVCLNVGRQRQATHARSHYQHISIEHSASFGRLYRLDNDPMASEADEFIIHESLAHLPALAHSNPRKALVLGGGDGASARELLKHPRIDHIVVAELDPEVVRLVGKLIPSLPVRAFDNPRTELRIGDAADTLQQAQARGERFDLILFDLTETDDLACAHLHREEFLRLCATSLTSEGMIHVQLGSPFYQPARTAALWQRMRSVFPDVRPALLSVPLYGGPWLLARAAPRPMAEPDPITLAARLAERGIGSLRHYNPDLHHACQVLPNYIRQLLA